MITVYIGKPKKNITGEITVITQETIHGFFDNVQSPSLFGDRKTFIIKNPFDDEDIKKIFFDALEMLAQGAHDIAIIVDKLLAPDTKKIEKYATIIKTENLEKKESKKDDTFLLANTFATGDKKKTWMVFCEETYHDDEIEKTHGMIWWKVKDMMMKRSVFSQQQLRDMARQLVTMYHESRLGDEGIKNKLEHFFLTMPDIKNK
jgi:DNA polymerase III delta subunit